MPAAFWSDKSLLELYHSTDQELLAKLKDQWQQSLPKSRRTRLIPTAALPFFGEKLGYLHRPAKSIVATVFVTKGGALKTSLTLNIARLAALHNIRTCVIGLDIQCDITSSLGYQTDLEDAANLQEALTKLGEFKGLSQLYEGKMSLESLLVPTDLPSLFLIPETPELAALDQSLIQRNRREYWLHDKVLMPLRQNFDLILLDGPPNWNRLITNALVGCDWLLSPLECKINNFRNFQMFRTLVNQVREELSLSFNQLFIPTRWSSQRKLSTEIRDWYLGHLSHCSPTSIRESVIGEEATALHLSIPEHAPANAMAIEMRSLMEWIFQECSAGTVKTAQTSREGSTWPLI